MQRGGSCIFLKRHFLGPDYRIAAHYLREKKIMGACQCGYTTDPEKNCNGTHKVVQAVKADIAEKLEANGFPHASEFVKNN